MNFNDLVGQTVDFYGVDNHMFRLGVEGVLATFEAVEDESDGYRSMMRDVRTVPDVEAAGIFFATPVAAVVVENADHGTAGDGDAFEGYALRDPATGHVWLELGTSNNDDYYPGFEFNYQPSGEELRIAVG